MENKAVKVIICNVLMSPHRYWSNPEKIILTIKLVEPKAIEVPITASVV